MLGDWFRPRLKLFKPRISEGKDGGLPLPPVVTVIRVELPTLLPLASAFSKEIPNPLSQTRTCTKAGCPGAIVGMARNAFGVVIQYPAATPVRNGTAGPIAESCSALGPA